MPSANTRVYIRLLVYDYDSSPRFCQIEHECPSVEEAKQLAERLGKGINARLDKPDVNGMSYENCTGRWLERTHHIYGFIERIEGIFEETTRRIA